MTDTKEKTEKPSWLHINDDLKEALSIWEDLSIANENKLSPEQEQLEKMKRLLTELKNKIDQFE